MTITINKAGVTIDGTPYAVPDGDAPLVEKLAAALEAVVAGSDEQSITLLSLASEAQQRERTARERTEKVRGQLAEEQIEWGRAQIAASCFEATLIRVEGALGGGNPDDDYSGPSVPEKLFRLLNEYPDINREWDNNPYADVPEEACRQYSERETLKRQLEEERKQVKYAQDIILHLKSCLVFTTGRLQGSTSAEDEDCINPLPKDLKEFTENYDFAVQLAVKIVREKKQLKDYVKTAQSTITELSAIIGADAEKAKEDPSILLSLVRLMAIRNEQATPAEHYEPDLDELLSYFSEDGPPYSTEDGPTGADPSEMRGVALRTVQALRWSQNAFYEIAQAAGIPEYGTPADYPMLLGKLKEIVAGARMERCAPDAEAENSSEKTLANAQPTINKEYEEMRTTLDGLQREYAALRKEQAVFRRKLAAKQRGYDKLKQGVYGLAQAAGIPTDDVPADYELTLLGQLEDAVTSKTGARLKKAQADIRGLKTQAKGLKTRVHSLEAELEEARKRERTLIDQYEPPDDDYTR